MFKKLCRFSMPLDSLTVEDVIRNPQQFLTVILTEVGEFSSFLMSPAIF